MPLWWLPRTDRARLDLESAIIDELIAPMADAPTERAIPVGRREAN